jgi:hypothetical protein
VSVARDLAFALDPVALFEAPGYVADGWQKRLLRSRSKRQLVLCSRQVGKSTTAAALATHEALYRPGSLTLLLSPSLRQSGEIFRKVASLYSLVGKDAPLEAASVLKLELKSGSRVVSLPGGADTVRGFSAVDLLVLDEASRVPDELVVAVRPMLAISGGRFLALPTPHGRQGWFYSEWTEGGPTWERTRIVASECPRITPEFLKGERASLGERAYLQEYQCRFTDVDDAYFMGEDISRMVDPSIRPLFPMLGPLEDDDALSPLGLFDADVRATEVK